MALEAAHDAHSLALDALREEVRGMRGEVREVRDAIVGTPEGPGFGERLRVVERAHARIGRVLWVVAGTLVTAATAWAWAAAVGRGP